MDRLPQRLPHTVSGVSAGAFMAVQHHVVWSSDVDAVGAVAGGPFWCAQSNAIVAQTSCMRAPELIDVGELVLVTLGTYASGFIDSPRNLAGDRVWLFSGQRDTVVHRGTPRVGLRATPPSICLQIVPRTAKVDDIRVLGGCARASGVVEKLGEYYLKLGVADAELTRVFNVSAQHAMPTLAYGNACDYLGMPYLNACDYDAAGAMLTTLLEGERHAPLLPPSADAPPSAERLLTFCQVCAHEHMMCAPDATARRSPPRHAPSLPAPRRGGTLPLSGSRRRASAA